jgi:putative sigma-54 modulation protein
VLMKITYTGQNLKIGTEVKKNIQEKLAGFEKYSTRLVEAHVILKKEKFILHAEISVLAKSLKAVGHGKSGENIFVAIDAAFLKAEKQLKKFREKTKDHHKSVHRKSSIRKGLKLVKADIGETEASEAVI